MLFWEPVDDASPRSAAHHFSPPVIGVIGFIGSIGFMGCIGFIGSISTRSSA
jgi:hypothetical protein